MFNFMRDVLQRIWQSADNITEKELFERELNRWLCSPARLDMICGHNYYLGKHDILKKQRTAIGKGGEKIVIDNLPNAQIIDNRYAIAVNQKVNYLLGKPLTVQTEDKKYSAQLNEIFNRDFMRLMKSTLRQSLNCGIAWIYPHYKDNELAFKLMPGYEILPFWEDNEHTRLACALRYYTVTAHEKRKTVIKHKVELYTKEGVYRYELKGAKLEEDMDISEETNFYPYTTGTGVSKWDSIPLIAFKNGSTEQPLINRVKSLQDGLNVLLSNFQDCMEENVRNSILVIKNYDGEDLGQFRQNLATYGAVKVKTVDGSQGGVETLNIEVNADNYKTIIDIFKKAIIENAMSYDGKDERFLGSPNQMNIQSMYMDIDLDTNEIETEFQAGFEELLKFINIYLSDMGKGTFNTVRAEVIFNRDMLINESEVIDNCIKSRGLLSDETILAQHTWVNDVQEEIKRLEKQNSDSYYDTLSHKDGEDIAE